MQTQRHEKTLEHTDHFNHSRFDVSPVVDWMPIILVGIAALADLLTGDIRYSNRKQSRKGATP
jgi:hypothetical protein